MFLNLHGPTNEILINKNSKIKIVIIPVPCIAKSSKNNELKSDQWKINKSLYLYIDLQRNQNTMNYGYTKKNVQKKNITNEKFFYLCKISTILKTFQFLTRNIIILS